MTSLYVISEGDSGPVKIGVSSDPESRLLTLQIGNPRPLDLFWKKEFCSRSAAFEVERDAHVFLGDLRQCGEWLAIEPSSAVAAITGACIR